MRSSEQLSWALSILVAGCGGGPVRGTGGRRVIDVVWAPSPVPGTYCDPAPAERPVCNAPEGTDEQLRGLWRPFDLEDGTEMASRSIYFDGCVVFERQTPWGIDMAPGCTLTWGEQGIVLVPALARDGVLRFGGCLSGPTELRHEPHRDVLVEVDGSVRTTYRRVLDEEITAIEHDLLTRCEAGVVTGTPSWLRPSSP